MPSLKKKFGTDKNAEVEGRWFDFGEGFEVKLARMKNPRSQEYASELLKPLRAKAKAKALPDEKLVEVQKKVIARYVLLGWRNIQDDEGKEIVFSEKAALASFEEYPDFFDTVVIMAEDRENFLEEEVEEAKEILGND